jgi:hypothetical protein
MITTIPTYCKERGVTRQFVYAYIKSGKFKHFEMPVFIELNGDKITLGMQKVLEGEIGNLEALLTRLTDDADLKVLYYELLTSNDKASARLRLNAAIDAHPDRDRLRGADTETNIRLMQHMKQTNDYLQNVLAEARAAVAQPA